VFHKIYISGQRDTEIAGDCTSTLVKIEVKCRALKQSVRSVKKADSKNQRELRILWLEVLQLESVREQRKDA
jgi:hypothetical protein